MHTPAPTSRMALGRARGVTWAPRVGRQARISLLLLCVFVGPRALGRERGALVPDFVLLDQKGRAHELARLDGKAVVVFVTGNGCPLARQSVPALKELRKAYFERGVTFWMLDANLQDDRASIAKEGDALDV